jgi:hypothetical protein
MNGQKDHLDDMTIRKLVDLEICRQTHFNAAFNSVGENVLDKQLAKCLACIPGIDSGVIERATDMLDFIGTNTARKQ